MKELLLLIVLGAATLAPFTAWLDVLRWESATCTADAGEVEEARKADLA